MKRILERSFVKRRISVRSGQFSESRFQPDDVSRGKLPRVGIQTQTTQSLKYRLQTADYRLQTTLRTHSNMTKQPTRGKPRPYCISGAKFSPPQQNRAQPASVPDPFPTDTRTKPSIRRKFFSFSVASSEHASMPAIVWKISKTISRLGIHRSSSLLEKWDIPLQPFSKFQKACHRF